MADPSEGDRIAYIAISLYGNGAMSVSGNIGDVKLALQMLDHARDAVNNQLKLRTPEGLMLPNRDVEVVPHPAYPLTPSGDLPPEFQAKISKEGVKP